MSLYLWGGVGWVSCWWGSSSWVEDWSCWGCCWGWGLGSLQSFFARPSPLSLLFNLSEVSIGVSEVLSLGLCLGNVAARWIFGVPVDVTANEVKGVRAERVLWVTGKGGGGFLDLVGVLSLGAGAFGSSSPFFLLLQVTCVHSPHLSPSGVALVVSVVLVVSLVLVVSVVLVIFVELLVLVVSDSLSHYTKSAAFWNQTLVRLCNFHLAFSLFSQHPCGRIDMTTA